MNLERRTPAPKGGGGGGGHAGGHAGGHVGGFHSTMHFGGAAIHHDDKKRH